MKIEVSVKISSQSKAPATLELLVVAMDTIESVKQRISSTLSIPFPDQKLIFDGKALKDDMKLGDCGVKEGSSLVFEVVASAAALTKQLSELLQVRALAPAELSLVYSHKHGVAIASALEMLGSKPNLEAFLQEEKFHFNSSGAVEAKLVQPAPAEESAAKDEKFELSVTVNPHIAPRLGVEEEITVPLSLNETVGDIKTRIVDIMSLPFHDVDLTLNGQLLDDDESTLQSNLSSQDSSLAFAYHCSQRVLTEQLAALLQNGPKKARDLSLAYTCRYGLNVKDALKSMGWGESLEDFAKRVEEFTCENNTIALAPASKAFSAPSKAALDSVQAKLSQDLRMEGNVVQNQPEQVKATAHLLRWWSEKQAWASDKSCPSNELLETIAVHAAEASQADSLEAAMSNAFLLMQRLDEVHVGTSESASLIVHQRPLLPHPSNPCRNVADPAVFDPRELMAFAKSAAHFC